VGVLGYLYHARPASGTRDDGYGRGQCEQVTAVNAHTPNPAKLTKHRQQLTEPGSTLAASMLQTSNVAVLPALTFRPTSGAGSKSRVIWNSDRVPEFSMEGGGSGEVAFRTQSFAANAALCMPKADVQRPKPTGATTGASGEAQA